MAHRRSLSERARSRQNNVPRKPSVRSKPDTAVQPMITFTGNRHNDRYEVVVRGEVVELPQACLKALIGLVLARASAGQGFARLNPVTVYRLRRAIDDAAGAGTGKALIETGASDEYRLTIPGNEDHGGVVLAPCFFELVQTNVLSREYAAKLEEAVSNCQMKSKRNRNEIKKKSNLG